MLSSMTGSGKPPQQNEKDLDFDDEARALFERYPSMFRHMIHVMTAVEN
jgi:hypothetical protein